MLVVSDTSPLNYLILIKCQEVLPAIFGKILIPSQVIEELQRLKAPIAVRNWANSLPDWVQVLPGDSARFPALNDGEAAALALALDFGAGLLVDDADARLVAAEAGVVAVGTVVF